MRPLDLRKLPRRVRWAMLLLPALLGGCYVVPVVPVRPYDRPYYRHHQRPYYPPPSPYFQGEFYYRSGQAEPAADDAAGVALNGAAIADAAPTVSYIDASSISR